MICNFHYNSTSHLEVANSSPWKQRRDMAYLTFLIFAVGALVFVGACYVHHSTIDWGQWQYLLCLSSISLANGLAAVVCGYMAGRGEKTLNPPQRDKKNEGPLKLTQQHGPSPQEKCFMLNWHFCIARYALCAARSATIEPWQLLLRFGGEIRDRLVRINKWIFVHLSDGNS